MLDSRQAGKGRFIEMRRRHFLAYGAAALVSSGVRPAYAEGWPQRPLTILVPFDVGGSADRLARGFAQYMPKYLGQPMTVVDRAGAGGMIGTTWFLHQPADGYTVMLTPATPFIQSISSSPRPATPWTTSPSSTRNGRITQSYWCRRIVHGALRGS